LNYYDNLSAADYIGPNNYQTTLKYTLLGTWAVYAADTYHPDQADEGRPRYVGEFVAGFQTPPSAMPTSGSATYSLAQGVLGWMATPQSGQSVAFHVEVVQGDANLTVDFASGQLTGTFTNMLVGDGVAILKGGPYPAWNDVSISASISGATFAGSAATTSYPTGSLSLGPATGTIRGGFYGPAADEVGAVWTLSDGRNTAFGTVGAPKTH
jgi:hypothetical protein